MKTLAGRTGTLAIVSMLAAVAAVGGCSEDPKLGYTLNDQYVQGVRTVAVPIWTRGREVYRRDLEFRLTEALVKQIELDTPYKVVSKADADTLLEGRIDVIKQQGLSKDPDTGRPREMEVTYVMRFTWTDLRSGEVLREHDNVRIADTYIPHTPISEEFFQGSESLTNRAARRIVEYMESDW